MTLRNVEEGKEYIIKSITTDDEELNAFCFHSVVIAESQSRLLLAVSTDV